MADNGTSIVQDVENKLEAPMHCIGMYVAAASLICTLAMAADSVHGFWTKKYWLPSRYFSINATSLTLMAVVMKLPVDLTTRMYAVTDRLAKVSSLIFMSTAMANFLPSLGSMSNNEVLMNVTALAILVITVTANVSIQVIQIHSYLRDRLAFPEEILAIGSMLFLLGLTTSSALMIPSTKKYLEIKYHEMHRLALDKDEVDMGRVTTDKLRVLIKKYWVMAETSSPQFVIARSATCTTSGIVSLIMALVLLESEIRMAMEHRTLARSISSYGWSTKYILITQTIGVIVGTIAPVVRWLIAINFRSRDQRSKSINSSFTVEGYWTQRMMEWRQSSLPYQIRHLKIRKFIHGLRGLFLSTCISAQSVLVLTSKLVFLISVCLASPAIACLNYVRRLRRKSRISHSASSRNVEVVSTSAANPEVDMRPYVMLLKGEVELPAETLENICKDVDEVIRKGKMHKPNNLLKLLNRSCNFNGVMEFDNHQVSCLHYKDLPYCWSLPVVTLTSIALALPNVEKHKSKCLLKSVSEGLPYVKLIDHSLDKKGGLANIRSAADVVWVGVELYNMWQDEDLDEPSLKERNAEETLQKLCDKAEETVLEFKREATDYVMRNPLNWPEKVIAANSMYRIGRTTLLTHGGESDKTDDQVFEQLSVMIADILAACLSNLAHVINMKCRRNAIEEREKSVRKAALLLGETEEILQVLQQRELPLSSPHHAASIEEWRALLNQEKIINQDHGSWPNNNIGAANSREEHIDIKLQG